jgi:hypothetical protein
MKTEEEIMERCKCCIHFIRIYPYDGGGMPRTRETTKEYKAKKCLDCKEHGEYGWFYFAEEIQDCSLYKSDLEKIMKQIIKKEGKNEQI